MKGIVHYATVLAAATALVLSCDERPSSEGAITVHGDLEMLLPSTETDTVISFTATAAWTIQVENGQWLGVEPDGGAAGDITAKVSAQANADTASRTATVRILCGTSETALTVTQSGKDTDTPGGDPDVPDGNRIRTMFISDGDDEESFDYSFEYDGDGRLSGMECTETYYEGYDKIVIDYVLDIEYSEDRIVISGGDGEYDLTIDAAVDAQGRATSVVYTEVGDDGYGHEGEIRTDVSLSYNSDGQLIREEGKEDGYSEYNYEYTWSDGNLISAFYDYYDVEFGYSEYANNSNIDINWLLTCWYGSGVGPLGIIGALGERSGTYAWPDVWNYADANDSMPEIYPVHEDLIGTTISHEYTSYESGVPAVDYGFDAEDRLVSILKSVPKYSVTYSQVYRYELESDSVRPDEDGNYYYGVILVPVGEPEEVSREAIDPEITNVKIGY